MVDPHPDDYGEQGPLERTQRVSHGSPYEDVVLEGCRIRVSQGPDAGAERAMDGSRFTIGSHPDNDLVLSDPQVSKRHLALERGADGVRLHDLGSTNGTSVNGVGVTTALLPARASIGIGSTRIEFEAIRERVSISPSSREEFGPLVGRSQRMRQIFGILERFARSDLSILIGGETGTGKELVARGIHLESSRSRGPFKVFDASNIAPSLLESELFGHLRGSFTGAQEDRPGIFELAHGGTLFLDEIGELPLELQSRLLRALEMKEVKRIGAPAPVKVDVRVLAATHRDLARMVEERTFREDLFYRLAVVRVELPPLRDRLEDIPLLVKRLTEVNGPGSSPTFSPEAMAMLQSQSWKGNVRQLRNVVQAALVLAGGAPVSPADLLMDGSLATASQLGPVRQGPTFRGSTLEEIEKEAILGTMAECGGNKSRAARKLGIAYSTLQLKLKKYGM